MPALPRGTRSTWLSSGLPWVLRLISNVCHERGGGNLVACELPVCFSCFHTRSQSVPSRATLLFSAWR